MQDEAKKQAAECAVGLVADNQIVGLGTGSTSRYAIEALAHRVHDGLRIQGVATSEATAQLARNFGIEVVDLNDVSAIDLSIDGADEVDERFDMIKGGGGALTREKLVALAAKKRIFIVDESKLVKQLGIGWPLPVEVLPFSWRHAKDRIAELDCEPELRMREGRPFETDNGNYILDCRFKGIADPRQTEQALKLIPGVIECGLFIRIADTLIIGWPDRVEVRERPVL